VRRLLKEGSNKVTIFDIYPPKDDLLSDPRILFIRGNVESLDFDSIIKIMGDAQTLFYKVGSLGDPSISSDADKSWDYLSINALSFWKLLPVIANTNVNTIVVDSSITAVSDLSYDSPISELKRIGTPTNFYGLSKAILEDICLFEEHKSKLRIRIIRYPRVYSSTQNSFLVKFATNIYNGEPIKIFGNPDKLIDLIHIEDATETAIRCMQYRGKESVFHASYNETLTLTAIAHLMCKKARRPRHQIIHSDNGVAPREPKNASLNSVISQRALQVDYVYSLEKILDEVLENAGIT